MKNASLLGAVVVSLLAGSAQATQIFQVSGTAADIQINVDSFRAQLGANNGVGGSFASGRREINWDGVPDSFASPNALPGNFFNANSPRGAVFSTPGTGFRVSADSSNPTNTPVRFADLNPANSTEFSTFSPERLFAPMGSTFMDVLFFIPGTNIPATVSGFGVIFTGVQLQNVTGIQLFGIDGQPVSGFSDVLSPFSGSDLSFVAMLRNTADIARVRITSGNLPIDDFTSRIPADVVAMDDFIYGEPVPAPGAAALLGIGGIAAMRRRRSA